MPRECINSLFDNFTWTKISAPSAPPSLGRSSAWLHPHVSVFVILLLFFIMKVTLPLAVCSTVGANIIHTVCDSLKNHRDWFQSCLDPVFVL